MPTAKKPAPIKSGAKVSKNPVKKVTADLKKIAGINAEVFDLKGKVVGKIALPKEVFGAKENKTLIAQAVRVYLANQRLGTSKTKSRGEVNLTTAKAYRQKGTGRARHGAKSAPIFVGGGVAFGPKPRNHELSLSQKMKRAALYSALSLKFKDGEVKIVEGFAKIEPKTKVMAEALEALAKDSKKTILVVSESLENVARATRNLKNIKIINKNNMNTYEILDNSVVLFMKEALESIDKNKEEK